MKLSLKLTARERKPNLALRIAGRARAFQHGYENLLRGATPPGSLVHIRLAGSSALTSTDANRFISAG